MLRGTKVTLRALERDDIKQLHELTRNVDLVLLSDSAWVPYPLASWEKQFDKHIEDQDQSQFIIEADGKIIGSIGLHPHPNRTAGCGTLGIAIHDPEYVGRGYGRDAIETFLDWAFRIMNFRRIKLETLATNERALRCYEACGFRREGLLREDEYCDGSYRDVVAMGVLRREWEQEHASRSR
ncbi:MAG: GNAT family N-acetyltransferase [Nitrososphaerota archaeon]